jgi:hypothetical protein
METRRGTGMARPKPLLADRECALERALAIRERALGPEHPDTANALNNLANVPEADGLGC